MFLNWPWYKFQDDPSNLLSCVKLPSIRLGDGESEKMRKWRYFLCYQGIVFPSTAIKLCCRVQQFNEKQSIQGVGRISDGTVTHFYTECDDLPILRVSLVAQLIKNPPAMWETWVQSLDLEDPLEEGMATQPILSAAAKLLQLCLPLCDPIDRSPLGSPVPGSLQARILVCVAISFSSTCMHAKSLQSCPTLGNSIDSSPPSSSVHRIL